MNNYLTGPKFIKTTKLIFTEKMTEAQNFVCTKFVYASLDKAINDVVSESVNAASNSVSGPEREESDSELPDVMLQEAAYIMRKIG